MAEVTQPLFTTEEEIEVDPETVAAINDGIAAAEEGRVMPAEEVRKLVKQWLSGSSTRNQR